MMPIPRQGGARKVSLPPRALLASFGLVVLGLSLAGAALRVLVPDLFVAAHGEPGVRIVLPAEELFAIRGFPVTNTLLSSCLATLLLVGLMAAARWRARIVPTGLQDLTEAPLQLLLEYVEGLAGPKLAPALFIFVATVLLFILTNTIAAVLPLYGPVVAILDDGSHVPLLRGAGTDINMALALAVLCGLMVEASGFAAAGPAYLLRFFRVRHLLRRQLLVGFMDLFVGLLEGLMHLLRVLPFTFRLFGTVTAGEVLIVLASFVTPLMLAVPFYGLELVIGAVQAWIFASLTVVLAADAAARQDRGTLGAPDA